MNPKKPIPVVVIPKALVGNTGRLVHLKMDMTKLIRKRWLKLVGKINHPLSITDRGATVHLQRMKEVEKGRTNPPLAAKRNGAVVKPQKMKELENVLGDIGIEALIRIVTHLVIIKIATLQGQRGERKDPLERRAAARNTQSTINIGAEVLLTDLLIIVLRKNVQNPGEKNRSQRIDNRKPLFSFIFLCLPEKHLRLDTFKT